MATPTHTNISNYLFLLTIYFMQQRHTPAYAEACGVGSHRAKTAFAAMRRQIDVYPRALVGKALQQPRRKNVIGPAIQRALLYVGNAAVERGIVIVIHRKRTHAFV